MSKLKYKNPNCKILISNQCQNKNKYLNFGFNINPRTGHDLSLLYYLITVPFFISLFTSIKTGLPSTSADINMPCDSLFIIFQGSRFAINWNFFPIKSLG